MDEGLLEEVRTLHRERKLGPQAVEALGYRQLVDHLEDRLSLEEAVEQIKIRTRRFAKQQRTWLKRFLAEVGGTWIDCSKKGTQDIVDQAVTSILKKPELGG